MPLLTIDQMAKLFKKSKSTVNVHIWNFFEVGELDATDEKL